MPVKAVSSLLINDLPIFLLQKKERLLKKQQREALLIDSFLAPDGFTTGRSLRDRKPVTYTFGKHQESKAEPRYSYEDIPEWKYHRCGSVMWSRGPHLSVSC